MLSRVPPSISVNPCIKGGGDVPHRKQDCLQVFNGAAVFHRAARLINQWEVY
jgi:hypothetical protein